MEKNNRRLEKQIETGVHMLYASLPTIKANSQYKTLMESIMLTDYQTRYLKTVVLRNTVVKDLMTELSNLSDFKSQQDINACLLPRLQQSSLDDLSQADEFDVPVYKDLPAQNATHLMVAAPYINLDEPKE